jgi:hypothetical protein
MGNTALGAQAFGFSMTGIVPQTITRAKDEQLRALGFEPYNYPKYARFDHTRSTTIAGGLILEVP